jgi:hypothetical protein
MFFGSVLNVIASTSCTANIKAVDGDAVIFLFRSLFSGVELAPLVDVFTAGGTFHREGSHKPYCLDFGTCIFGCPRADNLGGVEVGRIVFCKDFAFRHDELRFSFLSKEYLTAPSGEDLKTPISDSDVEQPSPARRVSPERDCLD